MKTSSRHFLLHSISSLLLVLSLVAGLLGSGSHAYAADYDLNSWKNKDSHWTGSTANNNNSVYQEGQAIPFRLRIHDANNGDTFNITYDYYSNPAYFIDYLTTIPAMGGGYDYIHNDSGPSSPNSHSSFGIPVAPGSPAGASGQYFWGYGVNITNATTPTGPTTRSLAVTYTGGSGWITWGAHLAESSGSVKGASFWPGASGYIQAGPSDSKVHINPNIMTIVNVPWVFAQTGLASGDYTGVILTVNGTNVLFAQLPYTVMFIAGNSYNFDFKSPLLVEANKKQYVWNSTTATSPAPSTQSGTITLPSTGASGGTVTGNYNTQYYLTMASNPVGITPLSGANWYNSGTNASISAPATANVVDGQSRNSFNNWTTSAGANALSDTSNSTTVAMDTWKTLTANYWTQYYLTMASNPVGITPLSGANWYNSGTNASISAPATANVVDGQSRNSFNNWTTSAGANALSDTSNSTTVAMDTWKTLTANYWTQYYLTMASNPVGITPLSGANWYNSGTNASISAPATANVVDGQSRNSFNNWTTSAGANALSDTSNSTTVAMDTWKTLTANYWTQYYLTMASNPVGITPLSGANWYNSGTNASISAPATANVVDGQSRNSFNNWTTSAGANALSDTSNSTTVAMDTWKTLTANYWTQYYLTMASNPVGITPLSGANWYNSGTNASISAPATANVVDGQSRNSFNNWTTSAGANALSDTSNSTTVAMDTWKTLTANYWTQYYLTMASNPVGITPLSGANWYNSGTNASISAPATANVVDGQSRNSFNNWTTSAGANALSDTSNSTTVAMDTWKTLTANYWTQYYLTMASNPVGITPLSGANWYNSGTNASISAPATANVVDGQSRNSFNNWTTSAGANALSDTSNSTTVAMDTWKTLTANYWTQYYLTMASNPVGITPLSGANWYNSGTNASISAPATANVVDGQSRNSFNNWTTSAGANALSDTSNSTTVAMDTWKTLTANYWTQYYLTMASNPVGITPLSGANWYNSGTNASISAPATANVVDGQSRNSFNNWTTSAGANALSDTSNSTTVAMDTWKTLTANYWTQYYLTMASNPVGITPLSGANWYNSGTNASISAPATANVVDGQSRNSFNNWTTSAGANALSDTSNSTTVAMDTWKTLTANYWTQYYLTMASNPVGITPLSGANWYNSGTNASISAPATANVVDGQSRNSFNNWTTSAGANALSDTSNSTTVAMDTWKTLTANYWTQYYLTMASNPVGITPLSGANWYNSGTNASISAPATANVVDGQSRNSFNNWTTSAGANALSDTSNSTTVAMDTWKTLTANYWTQYYLTMATNYGTVSPGSDWKTAGSTVPITATNGVPAYLWSGWTGSGTGSVNGGNPTGESVTMNSAITQNAAWTPPPPPAATTIGLPLAAQPVITLDTLGSVQAYPVSPDGALLVNVSQTSLDGSLTVEIPAGTIVLGPDGTPAYQHYSRYFHTVDPDVVATVAGTPPAPAGGKIVRAYQLTPHGLTFKGNSATISTNYKPGDVPQGATLTWAFYDETAGKWTDLETGGYVAAGTTVPNSAACRTTHFTYFALIAK